MTGDVDVVEGLSRAHDVLRGVAHGLGGSVRPQDAYAVAGSLRELLSVVRFITARVADSLEGGLEDFEFRECESSRDPVTQVLLASEYFRDASYAVARAVQEVNDAQSAINGTAAIGPAQDSHDAVPTTADDADGGAGS
jgi:hypothetical protein